MPVTSLLSEHGASVRVFHERALQSARSRPIKLCSVPGPEIAVRRVWAAGRAGISLGRRCTTRTARARTHGRRNRAPRAGAL